MKAPKNKMVPLIQVWLEMPLTVQDLCNLGKSDNFQPFFSINLWGLKLVIILLHYYSKQIFSKLPSWIEVVLKHYVVCIHSCSYSLTTKQFLMNWTRRQRVSLNLSYVYVDYYLSKLKSCALWQFLIQFRLKT